MDITTTDEVYATMTARAAADHIHASCVSEAALDEHVLSIVDDVTSWNIGDFAPSIAGLVDISTGIFRQVAL